MLSCTSPHPKWRCLGQSWCGKHPLPRVLTQYRGGSDGLPTVWLSICSARFHHKPGNPTSTLHSLKSWTGCFISACHMRSTPPLTAEAHAKPCVHTVNSPEWKDLSKVHLDPWKAFVADWKIMFASPLPFLKSPIVCRTKSSAERVALKLWPSASEIKHACCFFPNWDACWPLLSCNIKLSHFNFSGFLKVTLGNTNQSTPRGARALLLLSQSSTAAARWQGNGDLGWMQTRASLWATQPTDQWHWPLHSKHHCHRTRPAMTDSFVAWKSPSTFNSMGNRSKNNNCSGFLLPSIFRDTSHAVFLVFKSMIKPYGQWEEIPLPFVQRVPVCGGQLGMLRLSRAGAGLCGSHIAVPGQGAAISTHTHCAHQELNIDSQQVLHHHTQFCFSCCPTKPELQLGF